MEFKTLMDERHSVRNFSDREIDKELLREMVRIAAKTPSWENNQPWNLYIATGDSLKEIKSVWKEKYAEGTKGYADMPVGHRTNYSERSQANMASFMKDCEEKTRDKDLAHFLKENELLFNAPVIAYLTLEKGCTGWAVYDLGAFGMSLMLAAKDLGVDSIPAYEFVKFPDKLREILGIPESEDIIMGIGFGYPADDKLNDYRSGRMPVEKILTIKE